MSKKMNRLKLGIFGVSVAGLFVGCAPGPPPPPLFPGPGGEWIVIVTLGIVGFFLWRYFEKRESPQKDYLTDVLNGIHQQLKRLEKQIEKLEKDCSGKR